MINDKHIEHVARFMCREDGRNPDAIVTRSDIPEEQRHQEWREYTNLARQHISAHVAINQILRGEVT